MQKDLVTPDGMRVVVSCPGTKRPLPPSSDAFEVVESAWLQRRYHCGHRGPRWVIINTYGQLTKKITGWGMCPTCLIAKLKAHIIRCALCGLPVVPGDGVALYAEGTKGLRLEATKLDDGSAIGCMRWDCYPSGGFFAGNWSEQGFVPRFEGRTAAGDAMAKT